MVYDRGNKLDPNAQFLITVGTVIAVFLWLRNDINRLDAKIDRVDAKVDRVYDTVQSDINSLRGDINSVRGEVSSIRESLAWLRGRMGYADAVPDGEAE